MEGSEGVRTVPKATPPGMPAAPSYNATGLPTSRLVIPAGKCLQAKAVSDSLAAPERGGPGTQQVRRRPGKGHYKVGPAINSLAPCSLRFSDFRAQPWMPRCDVSSCASAGESPADRRHALHMCLTGGH